MSDVTTILSAIENGDRAAAEQLLPLVYEELRQLAAQRLAQEKPGQTLQATALVHEAYLRLVGNFPPCGVPGGYPLVGAGQGGQGGVPVDPNRGLTSPARQEWDSRGHFFAAAAEAMRRILIEQARRKNALKRGGQQRRLELDAIEVSDGDISADGTNLDILALNEALEKLERADRVKAELVKLRFFAGLTIPQAAKVLGISSSTADNYWAYARCWLRLEMTGASAQK